MKYYKFIKKSLFVAILVLTGSIFNACDEDIKLSKVDENNYITSKETFGYIINGEGKQSKSMVEFRNTGSTDLYLGLTKNATQDINAKFKYDKSVLDAYNSLYESGYEALPEELVNFLNNGVVKLTSGESKSEAISVTFANSESLKGDVSYVIPVSVEIESGNIQLSKDASSFLIFVKDLSNLPDANKSTGIKIISCMEVNDTNPLNNLCFTLKTSGKPLIDMVILFSANINYNNETGRVYVFNNPNVQHILDNRDKYLKPLQDRGIKIVLGILGNHDISGVANLADNTAREFAKELKATCDAYKLDGIFYDDEYSAYQYPAPAGFVNPSSDAAARLCYETKQAMPDKLVCAYVYSRTAAFRNPVDGVEAGKFVDYGIHDYGGSYDLSSNYPGMPKSGMALYSQEYSRGYTTSETNLKRLRDGGYGSHMIFAMDPLRYNFEYTQKPSMQRIAKVLFDDELVYDGKPYSKDW